MTRGLNVLGSWDLYLNIRPSTHLFLNSLLLASWAIEILSRLIHKLVGRRAAHGQIDVLGGAAPS